MALCFVQVLPVVAHDRILAETPWDSEARQFRGPPKRALVSWVYQVDWNSMKDKSISTLQQLRARSSVITTAPFLRFGYAPGHFPAVPFLEHLPEKPSKRPHGRWLQTKFLFCKRDCRTGQVAREVFWHVEQELRAPQKGKSVMYKVAL